MKSRTFVIFLLAAGFLTTGLLTAASIATATEPDPSTQAASAKGIAAEVVETESGIY